jgi:methylmalonyl-CoA/ethylmalonyl-CoA epimerase
MAEAKMGIKIKALEHISWAAPSVDKGAETLAFLGFLPTLTEDIKAHDVVTTYFQHPTSLQFEIIRPADEHSQLNRFLKDRGPGIHHICFQVENLSEACEEVKRKGWDLVGDIFEDSRGRHSFIHPRSTGGVLNGMIELHPGLV